MNIEALFDAVIVKPLDVGERKSGNIIIPKMGEEVNHVGKVVSIGPGKYSSVNNEFISTQVKVGTTVVLPSMGFTKFTYEGEEYYIGQETQILCKINQETKENE